jgi:septum formation protein
VWPKVNLVLASSSPRRIEILKMVNANFRVIPPENVEEEKFGQPEEIAMVNAKRKALSVLEKAEPGELVIGADTLVVLGNEVIGKPRNESEAVEMLKRLSGRTHKVITGICVASKKKVLTDFVESLVKFKRLSGDEIVKYVETKEPLDKAGAYGIQGIGALIVEEIRGDFFNVMGLPISRIYDILTLEFL